MGHITVAEQTVTFLLSLALGILFCVLYDIFRFLHKKCKSWFAVFVSDILYWLIAAIVMFCFLVLRTKGQVRGYALFGVALGFVVGKLLFGNVLLRFLGWLEWLFNRIFRLVLWPVQKIFTFLRKICKKIGLFIKKGLKNLKILLYNIFTKLNKVRRKLWVHKKSEK